MFFATRNTEGKGATMRRLVLGLATCSLAVAATASEPWPIRAVQLDLGRQMETVEFLKDYAEKVSSVGFNTLVLYLEGRVKTPSAHFLDDKRCYTPAQMREVVEHASKFGVECVPVVSILGHAELFLRYKESREFAEGRARKGWVGSTFCLSSPKTRDFLERYIAEVAAIFPSKHFHMGFDEAWDMGTCELCAPVRKEKGMGPLFTEFVKFAHSLAEKNGKRMWMWDDLWEFFPEELANCPKDIVMCNWKYDAISPWGIRARFADSTRVDWMALYAKCGIECLASCNTIEKNIRTFTAYARKHPNCIGGFVTQWEMSAMHHGIRLPLVLGAGLYWTKAWDDPAADLLDMGVRAAFPSLSGDDVLAAETLVEEQGDGHIGRPSFRAGANFGGHPRARGPHADDLALSMLRKCPLRPGSGVVEPKALSERALLDDIVTYVEFCRFRDTLRSTAMMFHSPERTAEDVRSAKAAVSAAEPRFREACARRWAQRNAWRGDAMWPHEFPSADYGRKEIAELLATPEAPAADDEWWLVVDVNLPDEYGNLNLFVYGEFDGEWKRLATGDWKPGAGDRSCFQAVVPFRSKVAPTALRISSEKGVGICGVDYVSCVGRAGRLVPVAVRAASGHVRDATNILADNHYPAVFGHPDRTSTTFAKDGRPRFVGTLEVRLGVSPEGRK